MRRRGKQTSKDNDDEDSSALFLTLDGFQNAPFDKRGVSFFSFVKSAGSVTRMSGAYFTFEATLLFLLCL
jgi:hypothetical protein